MNATQRALLKGIAAAPHDDAPRLVYADWLDEYAAELPKKEREATAARAEIIRVQCELARLAEEDTEARWMYEFLQSELSDAPLRIDWSVVNVGVARRVELHGRDSQLSALYGEVWRKAETPKIERVAFDLHRGFWTDVSFLQNGPSIREILKLAQKQPDLVPLRSLYCERQLTVEEARQLESSEWFAYLSAISGGLDGSLFTVIGQSPLASGVRSAFLQLGDDNVALPFSRKSWSGLRELHVMMHGEEGHLDSLPQLAGAKHMKALEAICIDLDGFSRFDTVRALADGKWCQLRRLDYRAFLMGDDQAYALTAGTALRELRYLRLGREVGGEGATALLRSTSLNKLVVLDLSHNVIRGLDSSTTRYAERPNLRVLNLASANAMSGTGKNGLSKTDLVAVAKSPATHNLTVLILANNHLADAAISGFLQSMRMSQLVMLDLSANSELSPATAAAIASCERLANLQALNLMWTKIGNAGAKALAQSKHLGKLRYLDVTNAGVTASGIAALRKRFGDEVVRA